MPAKPYNKELFDPFIERVAGRTADLVLGAIKPEFLRSGPQPVAPDEFLNKQAVVDNNGPSDDDDVYTVDEVCDRNKISRASLYKLWKAGRGPKYFKIGASTRITGRGRAPVAACKRKSVRGGPE